MQFAAIAPVQAFEMVRGLKVHMALAQYLKVPAYFKFFRERVDAGDVVIMDNGAYEGMQMADQYLAHWAARLQPEVVVLPDCPGDCLETLRRSLNYLKEYKVPKQAMMVLHAEDGELNDFIFMYRNCPVQWVGFSRLTKSFDEAKYSRSDFAGLLQKVDAWRGDLKHHALGMLNGDVSELPRLAKLGFNSCDSSAPIWRGLHGYSLGDKSWPHYAFQPQAAAEANKWSMAQDNLSKVLEACK